MSDNKINHNEDLRVFGRDTNKIFKEIDVIRRKQIELAAEHITLESTEEINPFSSHEETVESDAKRNLIHFENQEKALKSLMNKLDTLGQIMNDFREASDLNPHTVESYYLVDISLVLMIAGLYKLCIFDIVLNQFESFHNNYNKANECVSFTKLLN
ncbi:hypothetical protein K501DRAFT_313672 [Backusella circina FSU 941]|nr:hypothetical protein K501DRAFT_313672 [Backusella circina FSU 941]